MKTKELSQLKAICILSFLLVFINGCQHSEKSKLTFYSIAYTSKESSNTQIYLTDSEGKSKIKITNYPGVNGYSAWSPDGKQIAFYAKYNDKKTWSIHTMNSDGTNRKRLTHAVDTWDSAPSWSPDGRKIAFARRYKDSLNIAQNEIWLMNADGSEQIQIKPLCGGGPCFTPDGRIVYHSVFKDKKSEISIADVNGNNIMHLTNTGAEEWHPEVSPNGKQIAFMSDRDGNHEIYVMNIDGTNQKRLTFNDVRDSTPSWSNDGSQLIFYSKTDSVGNIYRMNNDGSSIKKIIAKGGQPAWLKINK